MPKPCSRLLLALGLASLSGCATGVYSIKMPIAGGTTVPIELGPGGMTHAENDDFKVESAVCQFDGKLKQGTYQFGFKVKQGGTPRSVKIEDVSDDEPVTMLETDHLTIEKTFWKQKLPPFTPTTQNAKWFFEIENSIRVYRFTIVSSSGKTEVLYEGFTYPGPLKELIRKDFGDTATPGAASAPAKP